ncbi:L,D-transpeptidase [Leptolyngbya sp. FACHB-261]|uniref:L,D-transpeptidase n=1 Tax=Leptolyngbya sp. FACHB-261 TaxID=2692806 RepID=UPI0016847BAA|nr:L,D-transpeptidase [Leptolyngbya sp. FACHB-261]MBD2104623.1 L,D-transpeptidase [Leptolyngbya sp. FACHB-261]
MRSLSWSVHSLFVGPILLAGLAAQAQSVPTPAATTTTTPSVLAPGLLAPDFIIDPPVPQPAAPQVETLPVEQPLRLEVEVSKRRVSLYRGSSLVKRYPIAVGRPGWETPTGTFQVAQIVHNPDWMNPMTGAVIRGGDPANPLGRHWIGFWTDGTNWIGFHGTNRPESVGLPVSHGCLRMHNRDVAELFAQVQIGVPVTVRP